MPYPAEDHANVALGSQQRPGSSRARAQHGGAGSCPERRPPRRLGRPAAVRAEGSVPQVPQALAESMFLSAPGWCTGRPAEAGRQARGQPQQGDRRAREGAQFAR